MLHADVVGERARLTPSKLALVDVATGLRLTYSDLDARVSACAHVLTESLALRKGDRLAVLAGNSIEFLELFFAAARTGMVFVPLNTKNTAYELQYILDNCTPRILLYEFDTPVSGVDRRLTIAEYATLRDRVLAGVREPFTRVPLDGEDLLCLLYTSGTTGRPKGVRVPHRMVAWNGYNTAVGWQLREDDVSPVFTPLYHAGGLGAFLVPILTIGGTIVLHRAFEVDEVWRVIEDEKCTVVLGVPTIYKLMMEAPGFQTADLRHVRWLISGGAPLPEYIIEAYQQRGVVFKQGYGLTEVGVNCFAMTVEDSVRKKGSIGKPLMFTEARVVDSEGRALAADDVGELLLRGPHVSQGYWNNPEATAEALDQDGWFHTGDFARRDADGFFYIAGRRKDLFISGGVNIYPAEIEAVLLQHPCVQDAAVIGVPHPTWGEAGVAFVVARPGTPPTVDALTAHLLERLSKYKVPREFRFIGELPRTAYGKVVKSDLQDLYARASR
jgi:fatty-acyl-CoA synthase